MKPRRSVPDSLVCIAAHQDGVVSREQALASGVSDTVIKRLTTSGAWSRLSQGVFFISPGPISWPALAWAGVLIGGPRARLGPGATVHLAGLSSPPDPIDVLVPDSAAIRRTGPWRFVRESPGVRSARSFGAPPRLPLDDAVVDRAGELDEGALVTLVTDALRMRLTTPQRLSRTLARRSRHPHRALLRGVLADADGIESTLELEYLRRVERAHGLPRPNRQVVDRSRGVRRDIDYSAYGLLVELDGRRGHEGQGGFRDMHRDNRHTLAGWRTLRFGWWQVTSQPCVVAMQVHLALTRGGHREPFRRCTRCADVPESQLGWLAS